MKRVLFCVALLCFVFSNCSEQPTSVSDTQNVNNVLSKVSETKYVPDTDITVQLRNDLNAGLDVTLPAGHYYVSESIIVQGYSGIIKGAGMDATIIENAQGFKAPEIHPIWSGYGVTEIFAIYWSKGDVTFKDMTILVTGDTPAEVHNNPFLSDVTTIDNAIVVNLVDEDIEGGITVTFKNLKIKGEDSSDPLSYNGKNLVYPLIVTGWGGDDPHNAIIKDCKVINAGSAAMNLKLQ